MPWRARIPGMELSCVATCSRGLEAVLLTELQGLGIGGQARAGAVEFAANWQQVASANLWLRTAARVLVFLTGGPCSGREDLYQLAFAFPWEDLVTSNTTVAVQVAGQNAAFANTHFAALVVKDALVDRLRKLKGFRPSVDVQSPDLRVVLHLKPQACGLYLDTSGEPLSHRGYRQKDAQAPLSECLAAGLLLLAGYSGTQPLLDPMCGSGTIVVEAALIATGTPPGLKRRFAFERWPFASAHGLAEARARALAERKKPQAPIAGRDLSPQALVQAGKAAKAAGVEAVVRWERGDVRQLPRVPAGTLIVTNPPYGVRLGEEPELVALYRQLGDAVKRQAAGSTLWLLLGNPRLARQVGLKAESKFELFNGPLRCQFCSYPVVEGQFRRKSRA